MNTVEVHTLVGAYVLDAVDDLERAAVERHLTECESCSVEVAELRATAARLGGAAAVPPPPALRERVLAEVRRTRQSVPLPKHAPKKVRSGRWKGWVAAAAAVVVVAAGVGTATYVGQQRRIDTEQAQAAELRAVIAAPDAKVVVSDVKDGGRLSVVFSAGRGEAVVVATDLQGVPKTQAYQLWTITGNAAPAPSQLLTAGASSGTRLLRGVGAVNALAMTREPAGGSTSPTDPILTVVPLRG